MELDFDKTKALSENKRESTMRMIGVEEGENLHLEYSVDSTSGVVKDDVYAPLGISGEFSPESNGVHSTTGGTGNRKHKDLLCLREESKSHYQKKDLSTRTSAAKKENFRLTDIFDSQN
jgi:hypothetical protein